MSDFQTLLNEAVTTPGKVHTAFTTFHNYSLGNQMLALYQLSARNIPLGPIATYKGWKALGRQVKAGEKAFTLLMPITKKRTTKDAQGKDVEKYVSIGRFLPRNFWFALAQTEGTAEVKNEVIPNFDFSKALHELKIEEKPFAIANGNVMGYAKGTQIAINPLDEYPSATRFHEMAHILLGHTKEGNSIVDEATREKSLKEVEAESVAYLCAAALELEGLEYSRGYIQGWLKGAEIPADSAQKIFKVAGKILEAGTTGLKKY